MRVDIEFPTTKQTELIDITGPVQDAVLDSGVSSGICALFVPHTTAGLLVNENWDLTVKQDLLDTLERLVPWRANYAHTEGNAAAHIKSCLVGTSATLQVDEGHVDLGRWQGVFFAEFDGPRQRRVWIRVIPDQVT